MMFDQKGISLCARYAYAPNSLHYCGPEKQLDLHAYVTQQVSDAGLLDILKKFETLFPYLQLIASENNIHDPFDPRVVEAYWIGNNLLSNVTLRRYERLLRDGLQLKRKLPTAQLTQTLTLLESIFPHHVFHVFAIFRRTGHVSIPHTIETMDSCRISWATVQHKNDTSLTYMVQTQSLVLQGNSIVLSEPVIKQCIALEHRYNVGDIVSLHWGYICDKLTALQKAYLSSYTKRALTILNRERIFA